MAVPINSLKQVQTYQEDALAFLTNQNCFFDKRVANFKFKNFEKFVGQLGDTVSFELPYRFVANDTLTVTYQPTTQREQTLTVDQSKNIAPAFTAEQFIFNVDEYMDKIGRASIAELGAVMEANVAKGILDHTYRFYGNGTTAISSYTQLATALAYFRNYGAANHETVGIIDDISQANIIGTGLEKFALDRNNRIANSWELGSFSRCDWFCSNLLPTQIAGYAGENDTTLTFQSINAAGTQITFTHGAGVQSDFFNENDLLYFTTNVRYLTFVGHEPSQNQVQVRITSGADSASGTVVADIYPPLLADASAGAAQNISRALTTSDTAKVVPSHRAGIIMSGKPLYVAMPRLPSTDPFPSAQSIDEDSGVSLRMYYGEVFGQNQRALVHDAIWGSSFVDEYCMRVLFPLS